MTRCGSLALAAGLTDDTDGTDLGRSVGRDQNGPAGARPRRRGCCVCTRRRARRHPGACWDRSALVWDAVDRSDRPAAACSAGRQDASNRQLCRDGIARQVDQDLGRRERAVSAYSRASPPSRAPDPRTDAVQIGRECPGSLLRQLTFYRRQLDPCPRVPPVRQIPPLGIGRQDDTNVGSQDGPLPQDARGALAFRHVPRLGSSTAVVERGSGRNSRGTGGERDCDGQRRPDGQGVVAVVLGNYVVVRLSLGTPPCVRSAAGGSSSCRVNFPESDCRFVSAQPLRQMSLRQPLHGLKQVLTKRADDVVVSRGRPPQSTDGPSSYPLYARPSPSTARTAASRICTPKSFSRMSCGRRGNDSSSRASTSLVARWRTS